MCKEKDDKFYDNALKTGGYNRQYFKDPEKASWYPVWSKILDNIYKNERIIDLGCGPGQFAQLAFRMNKNYVLGIDFSRQAIEMAKKRNPKYQNRFILGDIRHENLHNICYDVVVLCEVLEHIIKDLEIIEKIIQNKRVIISLPSFDSVAHVRYFKDEKSIIDRYESILEIKSMSTIKIGKNIYYVMIGIKK